MLSKRVVAISADKAFSKRLAAGLSGAGGTVETFASPDDMAKGEIKAELVVLHVTDGSNKHVQAVSARLKDNTSLIAVIPSSSIDETVKLMKGTKVSAVLVADQLEPASLSAVASRLLFGDIFGLEKIVPWGVRVHSMLVGDYQEKSVAISAVSDFAATMGVRRKYRESIEQCIDEMLMNALYDAPVDSSGKQMFADVPTKTRISLRMEQKAVVQYSCDGNRFALSVRDSYGALKGNTVVKYLDKCLHSEQQIDRKTGGAGLGLYIISNAATQFFINIYSGLATEAVCTFDLNAPKVQLKEFGIFYEKIDSTGRLVAGPSKLMAAGASSSVGDGTAITRLPRGLTAVLAAACALLLALIGMVAVPRLTGPDKSEISVTTSPPGATIEVDGRAVGSTSQGPLTIPDLDVGKDYKVTARIDGYETSFDIIRPQKGIASSMSLTLPPKAAVVTFESEPTGATVLAGDNELGTTPVTIDQLPARTEQPITLRRAGYSQVTRNVRIPAPGQEASVFTTLTVSPDFGSIRLESDPPGAQVLQNGELIAGLTTPTKDHLLQAGKTYAFTFKLAGYMPETRNVRLDAGARAVPVRAQLKPGAALSVEVNIPGARVTVNGIAACRDRPAPLVDCPVPSGTYRVRVSSPRPFVSETFDVKVAVADVTKRVQLGLVETASQDLVLKLPGAPEGTRRAAFSEGTAKVTVVHTATGQSVDKQVRVVAGRTVTVDGTP
ncbi:MAG: PEGA domain-containing protein [Deltaproteobacteria bacterium]|nr:PEGA domain-containing protein [Deltaproteobacteria bacterium]